MRASLFLLCAIPLAAQPASITAHPLPLDFSPSFIDSNGNVYATSQSGTIGPTPGAAQTQPGGGSCFVPFTFAPCTDAVIVKSDASGNIVWATLLGGPTNDWGSAVASDANGNVYVIGGTGGSFPTTPNAAIATSTTSPSFAAKISADGSRFLYSTYLPAILATPNAVTVDQAGNAYAIGQTADRHGAVVKISADGTAIVYAVTLGGSNQDSAAAIFVDASGNAYVTGATNSPDFPVTAGVAQSQLAGAKSAFVTKLDPNGKILLSTFLGGSGSDSGLSVQVDAGGKVYLAGPATSLDLPTTPGTFQPAPLVPAWALSPGGFFARLAPDFSAIEFASYLSTPSRLTLGSSGDFYIVGGSAGGFAVTPSAPLPCVPGGPEGEGGDFLAHFDGGGELLDATYVADDFADSLTLASDGSVLLAGEVASDIRFGGADWVAPACMTSTLLNSATLSASWAVPGEFVSLIGSGIGPESGVSAALGAVTLGGVQVMFDGNPAPILYAQSRQVNVQVPFEVNGQTVVTLNYNGATFGPFTVQVRPSNVGLFRLQPNVSALAYAVNEDGTINGPSNPARAGSYVALWGTGFGPLATPCAAGGLNAPGPVDLAVGFSVQILGGGTVVYAGGAPTLGCGIFQINMQVPANAAAGTLTLNPEFVSTDANGTPSYTYALGGGSILYVR